MTHAGSATPGRGWLVGLALFAAAAALGAGFAALGPVPFVRGLGAVALAGGVAGCALQLYALREFAPRAHVLMRRKLRDRLDQVAGAAPLAPTSMATPLAGTMAATR